MHKYIYIEKTLENTFTTSKLTLKNHNIIFTYVYYVNHGYGMLRLGDHLEHRKADHLEHQIT